MFRVPSERPRSLMEKVLGSCTVAQAWASLCNPAGPSAALGGYKGTVIARAITRRLRME